MLSESSEERPAQDYESNGGEGPSVLIRYIRREVVEAISRAQKRICREGNETRDA